MTVFSDVDRNPVGSIDVGAIASPRAAFRDSLLLGVVMVVAFSLRAWVLVSMRVIETDGVQYAWIAQRFSTTGSPADQLFHPLYPLLIALVQPVTQDYELAGRWISVAFGTLTVFPAYWLARCLLGVEAARLTAVFVAVHPMLVQQGSAVLTEATYTFFIVTGVWAGWHSLFGSGRWWWIGAGALLGLSYLTRPEGALYMGGLLLLGGLAVFRMKSKWAVIRYQLAAVGVFILLAGPYLLYLKQQLGYWTLTGKISHALHQDHQILVSDGESDLASMARHLGRTLRELAVNGVVFEKHALPDLLPGLLLLVVLPGVLRNLGSAKWWTQEGWLLLATIPPFATLFFHVEARVFAPALPFWLALAAAGTLWAGARMGEGPFPFVKGVHALSALVLLSILPWTLKPIFKPDIGAELYKQVAAWIVETQPPEAVIMDRKPFIAFYSGRPHVPLPDLASARLSAEAQKAGATIVVLDGRTLADRAGLLPLVTHQPPAGLGWVRDFVAADGSRIRLLQVVRAKPVGSS